MTLHELESASTVNAFKSNNANTLICFAATWSDPCEASKPQLEQLALSYQQDPTTDVKFGIVYEHNLAEAIHELGIQAFPTYILYIDHGLRECGKIEGVNFDGIKKLIAENGCKQDMGEGHSVGDSGGDTPMEIEPTEDTTTTPEDQDVEMKDESKVECEKIEMVDPTENLSKEHLETLTGAMGFSLLRAQKGLLNGNGSVEGAVDWLMSHQDDDDIDDPIPLVQKLHANKTGHSDFEESTEVVKPLTAEEKAAKVEEIKALLKAKRELREKEEKVDHVEREKQRRSMGQQMAKTKEEMQRQAMARDAIQRKKEKEAFKRERARIKAEIEKDKAERRAHKGKLTSKLGIEGYNPDAIQYDVEQDEEQKSDSPMKKKPKASVAKIDDYIKKVSSYRAGGDGGKCLKVLLAYVGNVVDKPDEDNRYPDR